MNDDLVLAGATRSDVDALRDIADGRHARKHAIAQLIAKGWACDVVGVQLMTLEGRTLLDKLAHSSPYKGDDANKPNVP